MVVPAEYIFAADTALLGVVFALGVALGRTRERVARLEEWQRLAEKREDENV